MRKILVAAAMLVALVAPAAAEPFHHPYGEWREYNRDWLAACPDVIDEDATDYYGFSCFASTGSQELNSANLPAYKLTVLRNRLTGALDLSFVFAAEGAQPDTSRPLVLAFTGQPSVSLDFATDLETRYNTTNQYYLVDADRNAALLETLKTRNAVTLQVPLQGQAAASNVRLSLRGLLASIDFMAAFARRVAQY